MSTADKLNALVQTKADIKQALIDKGQNPSDVFSSYADDIRAIETGGGGRDWTNLGYSAEPNIFDDGFNYAISLLDKQNNNENIFTLLTKNPELVYLPNLDWNKLGNLYGNSKSYLIAQNDNLEYVDVVDLSEPYNVDSQTYYYNTEFLFQLSPKLKKVKKLILPIKDDGVSLSNAFASCSSLEEVNIEGGKVNNLNSAFLGTALKKIPQLDTSLCSNMTYCFRDCEIQEADFSNWDFSNITSLDNLFYSISATPLKKVNFTNFNAPKCTRFDYMFLNNSNLEEVIIPEGFGRGVENFSSMFKGCKALPLEQINKMDTSSGTNFSYMFQDFAKNGNNDKVTLDFTWMDVSKATTMASIFQGNNNVKEYVLNGWNTRNANMSSMFNTNSYVVRVNGELSVYSTNTSSASWLMSSGTYLRVITFKDIGENDYAFNASKIPNWGMEYALEPILSEGAKQSVVDSLIKYSFDRASAGKSASTITLGTGTKALLTEDEIAQITAKGFTIA